MPSLSIRRVVAAALAVGLMLTSASSAIASDRVRRQGTCSSGGAWRLEVEHDGATTLRVRFRIENTPSGDVWEVFLSDDGTRFFAGTRTANSAGEVRVSRLTKDLAGTDRIKAYAYSRDTGETCSGSLAYDR
jgi:hypothetical protein